MAYQREKFETFRDLMVWHTPQEGPNIADSQLWGTYKTSSPHARIPEIDVPALWIVGQGRKICYAGDQHYEYSAGNVIAMFHPMSVETEIIEASPETPFLVAGVAIDLVRMADVLLRLDRIEDPPAKPVTADPSGIFRLPLTDSLLDPLIRLFRLWDDPRDAVMLGASIVDEIYYRLLCDERGGELRSLLQQRGEIQRIARAVAYIHTNLDQPVSVEDLAELVHMSRTTFYENFKAVMHLSPLQYAKSVKLDRARALIQDGKNASEAGYLVGYNSPAQFSREYKRHFGYAPSAT